MVTLVAAEGALGRLICTHARSDDGMTRMTTSDRRIYEHLQLSPVYCISGPKGKSIGIKGLFHIDACPTYEPVEFSD